MKASEKKTARTKKLVAGTVTKPKETKSATKNKRSILAVMRILNAKTIDPKNYSAVRYLDHAAMDALTWARLIVPSVADVATHPLPAWQDLIATPVSRKTLAEVTNEITDYLCNEYQFAAPGMMHGLKDFLILYQGNFIKALRCLTEKKIATAETLGKTCAKKKLVEAFAALPSFPSPEAFENYCQRIHKRNVKDPTDEIVLEWRQGKPSPFPSPEAFANAFRDALKKDAEATAEINNGGTTTAAPCGLTEESGSPTKYRKYPQDAEAIELLNASAKRLARLRKDNPNATCKEAVKKVLDEPDGKETNADRQKRLNLIARVWHGAVRNGQRTDAKRQPPERLSQPERERALATIYKTWSKYLSAYIKHPPAK